MFQPHSFFLGLDLFIEQLVFSLYRLLILLIWGLLDLKSCYAIVHVLLPAYQFLENAPMLCWQVLQVPLLLSWSDNWYHGSFYIDGGRHSLKLFCNFLRKLLFQPSPGDYRGKWACSFCSGSVIWDHLIDDRHIIIWLGFAQQFRRT